MTRASRRATGRHHRAITCTVLTRRVRHGHQWQQPNKHAQKTFSFTVRYCTSRVSEASKKKTQKGTSNQVIRNLNL